MYKITYTLAGFTGLILSTSFAFAADTAKTAANKNTPFANVELGPKSGSAANGHLEFRKVDGGILINATVNGVTPAGKHGIHIHEKGDCTAADATSAGDHFNPLAMQHAAPNHTASHIGDLGNIEVDEKGYGTLELTMKDANYDVKKVGGWDVVVGKSVILHAKEDNFKTQPTGDAGGRIACGVIKAGGGVTKASK